MRTAVTIREVASEAGVSVATVSNALSGRPGMSTATRARVVAVAASLGYQPNISGHSLRTGRQLAVGLIIPDITNPFFAEVASGVEEECEEAGYTVFLANVGLDSGRQSRYLARLARASDGLIIFPTTNRTAAIAKVVEFGCPTVVADEQINVRGVGGVFSDNVDGGRLAAGHLLDQGAKRIALVGGPASLPSARDRRRGFEEELQSHGAPLLPHLMLSTAYTIEDGQRAASRLIDIDPDVDAIFAADDLLAIGVIEGLAARGLRVPDDVLVCGFDGIMWGERIRPRLTTVTQQSRRMGSTAAQLLLGMLNREQPPETVVLPVSLTVRDSTVRGSTADR